MTAWSLADVPDLTGKVALITGANAGLGLEISRDLAGRGARVLMACRNQAKAEAAAQIVRQRVGHGTGTAEVLSLDLADLASVRALAALVREQEPQLHILGNNAGLMAVDESRTVDGFETQFGVNHLGHFVLTAELMPLLLATPGSRVVNHASMGHRMGKMHFDDLMYERRGYRRWAAYFQSKLSNLLFTAELQRRLDEAGRGTIAVTAHPGGSNTDLGQEGTGVFNKVLGPVYPVFSQSAAKGAEPFVRAATAPDVVGGEYYGPRFFFMGSAVRERPNRRARNADDARRLWTLSEELTSTPLSIPAA
jgi:NAD(P)-dependent dehydrogenase (short-subunit alcohol dehydrogenase family)